MIHLKKPIRSEKRDSNITYSIKSIKVYRPGYYVLFRVAIKLGPCRDDESNHKIKKKF